MLLRGFHMQQTEKRKPGRPKGSTKGAKVYFPMKLEQTQLDKLKRLGGAKWIRNQIDKAKPV